MDNGVSIGTGPLVVIMGYQAPQMTPLVLGLAALLVAFLGDAGCRYRCVPCGGIKTRRIRTGAALAIYGAWVRLSVRAPFMSRRLAAGQQLWRGRG